MSAAEDNNKPEPEPTKISRHRLAHLTLNVSLIAALLLLLSVTLAMISSMQIQPLYGVIESTPLDDFGRRCARLMHVQAKTWRYRLAGLPYFGGEDRINEMLKAEISRQRPTHLVVLADGEAIYGTLSELEDGYLCKHETRSGVHILRLSEEDIAWCKKFIYSEIELSSQDCRFLLDFPGLHYYRMPPYLFVADVPYKRVHEAYETLEALRAEVTRDFQILIDNEVLEELMHVCLFNNRKSYLKYAGSKEDIDLTSSMGMYMVDSGVLNVYDPLAEIIEKKRENDVRILKDTGVPAAENEVSDTEAEDLQETADSLAAQMAAAELENMQQQAHLELLRSLRHEGAHQLAYTYDIHSRNGNEPLWLLEGFAQYCEISPLGEPHPQKMAVLRQALLENKTIPWQDLFAISAESGFAAAFVDPELAYAQSWFAFYHFAQRQSRAKLHFFMDSLRRLKPGEATPARQLELLEYSMQAHLVFLLREMQKALAELTGIEKDG